MLEDLRLACVECPEGSRNPARGASECARCRTSMECPSGSALETCRPGSWGEATDDMREDAAVAAAIDDAPNSWVVAQCRLGLVDGGSGANSSDTTAAEEQDIDPEECPDRYAPAEVCLECSMREGCLGGSLCSEGYEGYACSDCAFQFYLLNAKCHPCGDNAWIALVGGGVVFGIAATVVYHFGAASDGFVSLSVTITHVQLLSSYAGFSVAWPPIFIKWMRWVTALVMMKLEFVAHPECSIQLSHLTRWALLTTVPLIFAAIFVLWFLVKKLWLGCCGGRDAADKLAAVRGNCVRSSMQILFVLYIYVLQKALEAVDCTPAWERDDAADGGGDADVPPMVLASNPSVQCTPDDAVWPTQLAVGLLLFFFIGVGLPVSMTVMLVRTRSKGKDAFNSPGMQLRYLWMVRRYSGNHYLWEIGVLLRKALNVFLLQLLTETPVLQSGLALAIVVIALAATWWKRPYRCAACVHRLDRTLYQRHYSRDAKKSKVVEREGRKLTKKIVGRSMFRILLAQADTTRPCRHRSTIGYLDMVLLFSQGVVLGCSLALGGQARDVSDGATVAEPLDYVLISTVAGSIVVAVLFDVRWWMNSHAKQLQIKLQVAEEEVANARTHAVEQALEHKRLRASHRDLERRASVNQEELQRHQREVREAAAARREMEEEMRKMREEHARERDRLRDEFSRHGTRDLRQAAHEAEDESAAAEAAPDFAAAGWFFAAPGAPAAGPPTEHASAAADSGGSAPGGATTRLAARRGTIHVSVDDDDLRNESRRLLLEHDVEREALRRAQQASRDAQRASLRDRLSDRDRRRGSKGAINIQRIDSDDIREETERIHLEHELERHQLRVAEANSRKAQQARLQERLAGQRGERTRRVQAARERRESIDLAQSTVPFFFHAPSPADGQSSAGEHERDREATPRLGLPRSNSSRTLRRTTSAGQLAGGGAAASPLLRTPSFRRRRPAPHTGPPAARRTFRRAQSSHRLLGGLQRTGSMSSMTSTGTLSPGRVLRRTSSVSSISTIALRDPRKLQGGNDTEDDDDDDDVRQVDSDDSL